MNLKSEIDRLKARLDGITDPETIGAINNLLNAKHDLEDDDWWHNLNQEQQHFLQESLTEARQGKKVTSEDVHAKIDKLLSNE